MKTITLTLLALLSVVLLFAQSPQSFKYQAVARNLSGDILSEQDVSFRISILESSAVGTAVYEETHLALTNQFGLVNLEIGNGATVTGIFEDINWGSNLYFLKIELDETGNTNYLLMGTSQLLSVPYALFSENTANPDDNDWTISGDDIFFENTGNVGIGTVSPNALLDVAGHISISSTGSSVFVGYGAGTNDDLSSNYNNFVGYLAGNANTIGDYNCAFGTWALNENTNGYGNNAFGDYALINNTTGNENCAFGYIAMHNNETGSGNTVMGNSALRYNVSGSNNTALGFYAGHNNHQSGGVYIGYKAGYNSNSSNKLYIENSDSNSPLIFGDFGTDILAINGKLGVGTHTPGVDLHIASGSDATLSSGGYLMTGSTSSTNIIMDNNEIMARNNGSASSLNIQMDGGAFTIHSSLPEFNEFVVLADGKTGIGENVPDSKLHINTNSSVNGLRVQVNGTTKLLAHTNGSIALYNASSPAFALELQNSSADLFGRARAYSWNTYSDTRLKSNQRNIEYGLKEVLQLQPKCYDHHSSSTNEEGEFIMVTNQKEATVGFIAQEVEKIIPEAVNAPKDDSQDLWSMDYSKIIPVLTKAIQEQQEMIEEMQMEIKALKNQSE